MKNKKAIALKYTIGLLFGSAVAIAICALQGYDDSLSLAAKYRILCDAFTIPGMLLIMFGLLVSVSTTGALDGISYLLKLLVTKLIPLIKSEDVTYYDYVEKKRRNRAKGYGFLYICGFLFLAVALVFLYLYYNK